jgi:hypothetical protein
MGKGPEPSDTQTVTNKVELPPWLDTALQGAAGTAGGIYRGGNPPYYPGQTVNEFGPDTRQAMGMSRNIAMGGGPLSTQAALGNFGDTMAGDYLYGGEGFNAAVDAATRKIGTNVHSMFGRAGRHNSGLADAAVAEQVADRFAGLYGDERQRQMQGLTMAPQFDALAYQPSQRLGAVGAAEDAMQADRLADARARWEYEQYQPQTEFDQYLSRLQGIAPMSGQTSTQTSPLYTNRGAGMMGGAMTGLSLGGSLAATPWLAGTAAAPWLAPVGAGLGLLSSIWG